MSDGRKTVRRAGIGGATLVAALVAVLVAGCGGGGVIRDGLPPGGARDVSGIGNPVPRVEPRSRYGNPRSYVVRGRRYYTLKSAVGYRQRGIASWYGRKFHGRRTSSGELYDMYAMTAAHRTLPLPTYLWVINLEDNRRVIVRVNDRGPFHENRIIDLSYAAAKKLGIVAKGTGYVELRAINPARPGPAPRIARAPPKPVNLFLQAGAFAVRSNAERLRARLLALPHARVRISETRRAGAPLYRVRLGPLAGVEQADRLSLALEGLGLAMPYVVLE